MSPVSIKTPEEIEIMKEAGSKLAKVRDTLFQEVKIGVSAMDIEKLACELIEKEGAEASFKKVPQYKWATCININDGVVHGIPHKHIVFKDEDLVSVDVGLVYKGFNSDTSFTKLLGENAEKKAFLEAGKEALSAAIKSAVVGNKVRDISDSMEKTLRKHNLNPIKALTGHGIGKKLHESPLVPCFVSGQRDEKVDLVSGMTLAIEVMYTKGSGEIVLEDDGWTLSTKDAKIASLFEETVAITSDGPIILTTHKVDNEKVYGKE